MHRRHHAIPVLQKVHFITYNKLSIYRGDILYDSAHSTTSTMIRHRSDLHSQTIPVSYMKKNYMNPGYFTLAAIDLNRSKCPCFCTFPLEFGGSVISTHIRTEGLYVKTTIIYQLKRQCVPDYVYTENMFINSIHISLYDISLTQNIYIKLKETWLYERDSDAPRVISEPGGK